ncbi:MAG: hypothetical protein QGD96_12770 [Anaerolineae bacterium]|nr:hypothetical protein [Anaerolineae bacterium]
MGGEWKINPSYNESKEADRNLVVAGTSEGICMVEGSSSGISEKSLPRDETDK